MTVYKDDPLRCIIHVRVTEDEREWLRQQPGGASDTIRRLIYKARFPRRKGI